MSWLWIVLIVVVAVVLAVLVLMPRPAPVLPTVTDDPALPTLSVRGVRLHVQVFGPQGAPVIVVLHGGPGGDHRSLLPLQALGDQYRVVFYDQRGAGLSQRVPDADLTYAAHLEELNALLDHVSPHRPVSLIGHSRGAILATGYLGTHPDRVDRAVLIEPGFLDATGMATWMVQANRIIRRMLVRPGGLVFLTRAMIGAMRLSGPDADAARDHVAGRMVHAFANHPDVPYACPGTRYDSPAWRIGARAMSAVPRSVSPDKVDAIADRAGAWPGRALFLTGSCDSWIGTVRQSEHAKAFQHASLIEIAEAGHDVVDDRPDAALAAIRGFLGG